MQQAIPYIVLAISFTPYFMAIAFFLIGLRDYNAEKKANQENN